MKGLCLATEYANIQTPFSDVKYLLHKNAEKVGKGKVCVRQCTS